MGIVRQVARAAALGAAVAALAVGCAARTAGHQPATAGTAEPTPVNDPTLLAAADEVAPMLESAFPDSYAGLRLDHSEHVMTIYRRPDPKLDAAVRARVPAVRVVFEDAKYSLVWMRRLASRIVADERYWASRGMHIQSVAPLVDGSGVRVGTTEGRAAQAAALSQRYGAGTVSVERISAIPD